METSFIGKRISELCPEKDVSEREISLAIGKNPSYINYITNGKMLPTMESFLDISMDEKVTRSGGASGHCSKEKTIYKSLTNSLASSFSCSKAFS